MWGGAFPCQTQCSFKQNSTRSISCAPELLWPWLCWEGCGQSKPQRGRPLPLKWGIATTGFLDNGELPRQDSWIPQSAPVSHRMPHRSFAVLGWRALERCSQSPDTDIPKEDVPHPPWISQPSAFQEAGSVPYPLTISRVRERPVFASVLVEERKI